MIGLDPMEAAKRLKQANRPYRIVETPPDRRMTGPCVPRVMRVREMISQDGPYTELLVGGFRVSKDLEERI